MQRGSKYISIIAITLVGLWFSTAAQAQETLLRWKNGDSLTGKLLDSKSGKIRWKSGYFVDDLVIDINVLDSIVFSKQSEPVMETFRVGTVSGDSWTADIIGSDENTLLFSSKRYGKFRVNRSAIYSLESREHSNLLFDGAQLRAWMLPEEDQTKGNRPLSNERQQTDWRPDHSGHPQTTKKKTNIFHAIEWPERFEIDLEIASVSRPPGFVFALGKNLYEALRLETWVNELVVVQGTLFEPVMKIEPDRRNFRLRLAYDQRTGILKVFDLNGNLLMKLNDVAPTVKASGLYIYNRGEDLTVRRLRVYRQPAGAKIQQVDFTKPRVHMMSGEVFYGKLIVEKDKSYVLSPDGVQQNIDLQQVDRIVQPGMTLTTIDEHMALRYADGSVLRGQVVQLNPDSVLLKTTFADKPINCSLTGAALLRFESTGNNRKLVKDYDKMYFPSGSLRGRAIFDSKDAPDIRWHPVGASEPVRIANDLSPRVERNSKRISRLQPFDVKMFPHLLHLKNGEVIPCQVMSYNDAAISFRSPFISETRIDAAHIKGIEFTRDKTHARKENRNPITITGGDKHRIILEDGRILEAKLSRPDANKVQIIINTEKMNVKEIPKKAVAIEGNFPNDADALKRWVELRFDPLEIQTEKLDEKLERALTVPRFNRENPPNHILVANNGDLKRGKLLGINAETIQFDSKLKKITVPIDRVARVVDISAEDLEESAKETIDKEDSDNRQQPPTKAESQDSKTMQSVVRFALIHNPILIFEPTEVKGDKLFGRSPIYGEVSVPINSIQYIHFGEKAKSFKSIFEEWVARPAKEPDFGEDR